MGRKKRCDYPYLLYRSNIGTFTEIYTKLKKHVNTAHIRLMEKTPFWSIFNVHIKGLLIEDVWKYDDDVVTIIERFKKDGKYFDIGGNSWRITATDIAAIFGLPEGGTVIEYGKRLSRPESKFVRRNFSKVDKVSKAAVEIRMFETCQGSSKDDEEDFVCLMCIYLCMTLLFCNTNYIISWRMVSYCEDINKMKGYAWASATADLLENTLANKNPQSVTGCVAALLFWLCEKTQIISPTNGKENMTPRFVQWNLGELHKKLDEIDLETMKPYVEEEDINDLSPSAEPLNRARMDENMFSPSSDQTRRQTVNNDGTSKRNHNKGDTCAAEIALRNNPVLKHNMRSECIVASKLNPLKSGGAEFTPELNSSSKPPTSNEGTSSNKEGTSDFPDRTLISSQFFQENSPALSDAIVADQHMRMGWHIEKLEKENGSLKREISKVNVKYKTAAVMSDLLCESVSIVEANLAKMSEEMKILQAQNQTLRKEVARLQNHNVEHVQPSQRSMVRGKWENQRKKKTCEEFDCESLGNRRVSKRKKENENDTCIIEANVTHVEESVVKKGNIIEKRNKKPAGVSEFETESTKLAQGNCKAVAGSSSNTHIPTTTNVIDLDYLKGKKAIVILDLPISVAETKVGKCLDEDEVERLRQFLRSKDSG